MKTKQMGVMKGGQSKAKYGPMAEEDRGKEKGWEGEDEEKGDYW